MKPYRILIFIILVITGLGLLAAFFPEDGIAVGNITLRFPSLETVMTREDHSQQEAEARMMVLDSIATRTRELNELKDTLSYYNEILSMHPARFYVPEDDIGYFDSFFEALDRANEEERVVRILHYGDSQIEMDRISSDLRAFFQQKFGGGGPGLLPLEQTIPSASVYQQASGDYEDYAVYGTSMRTSNREYGLMGRFYRVHSTAHFTATATKNEKLDPGLRSFSRITLLFKDLKGGFSASLKGRGLPGELAQTNEKAGYGSLTWQLDTVVTRISLNLKGAADIYGILLDNGFGANVDNIPLRGSSGTIFTSIRDSSLSHLYELADVGLVILQFGGNSVPGIYGEKGVQAYKERIASQIRYIRNIYPNAKLLFIGPSDMSTRVNGTLQTYPWLPAIVEALKEAAIENDAAFWDMYEVMGGHNSMLAWVRNGYAGNDYIHFTPTGATKIGKALSGSFEVMYDFYRMRKETPGDRFDEIWANFNTQPTVDTTTNAQY